MIKPSCTSSWWASNLRRRWAFGLVAIVASGCGGPTAGTHECDPTAVKTLPITTGSVVGIGSDQEGTIYLVDQTPAVGPRLFASQGAVLMRQAVSGSGSINDADGTLITVTSGGSTMPIHVEVHIDTSGHPTAMGIFRGVLATKTFEIGALGEELQVLPNDAISSLTLQNLPGTVTIRHLAQIPDGRQLMVTMPDVDATEFDLHVFFGAPPKLIERRAKPGTAALLDQVTFDLDGNQATATFTSPLIPDTKPTLSVGNTSFPLTELPTSTPATPPAGASFLCF